MSANQQKQMKKLREDLSHVNNKLQKYERKFAVLEYKIGRWRTIQRVVESEIAAKEREIATQSSHNREAVAIEGQIYMPDIVASATTSARTHYKACLRCGKYFLCDNCSIVECRLCLIRPETPPPPYAAPPPYVAPPSYTECLI